VLQAATTVSRPQRLRVTSTLLSTLDQARAYRPGPDARAQGQTAYLQDLMDTEVLPIVEAAGAPAAGAAAPPPADRSKRRRTERTAGPDDAAAGAAGAGTKDLAAAAALVTSLVALNHDVVLPSVTRVWQALVPLLLAAPPSTDAADAADAERAAVALLGVYARLRQSDRGFAALGEALAAPALQTRLGQLRHDRAAESASVGLPVWSPAVLAAVGRTAATLPPGQRGHFLASLHTVLAGLPGLAAAAADVGVDAAGLTPGATVATRLVALLVGRAVRELANAAPDAVQTAADALHTDLIEPWLRRLRKGGCTRRTGRLLAAHGLTGCELGALGGLVHQARSTRHRRRWPWLRLRWASWSPWWR